MKRSAFSLLVAVVLLALGTLGVQAAPVNATGHWVVQVTNGADLISGAMTCNVVGSTAICKFKNTTVNGTMVSDTQMNGKWDGPKGAGWITVFFQSSGNSFQGEWGFNGRPPAGQFVGRRATASM